MGTLVAAVYLNMVTLVYSEHTSFRMPPVVILYLMLYRTLSFHLIQLSPSTFLSLRTILASVHGLLPLSFDTFLVTSHTAL